MHAPWLAWCSWLAGKWAALLVDRIASLCVEQGTLALL